MIRDSVPCPLARDNFLATNIKPEAARTDSYRVGAQPGRDRQQELRVQSTLVQQAMAGDEEAFASLARASGDRLLAVAYRILQDLGLAEDAVQQALVTAWRELPGLRDVEKFDGWMYRLLVHACYAESRRGRTWASNVRELSFDGRASGDETHAIVDRDQLERAFRRLPAEQRAVFVFHHYLGLSMTEIASQLDVPVGTVKSRMHYATGTLRAAVEADLREPGGTKWERPA
jgi:RNA polymerase sigma-70 factor, ECF subfamily